MKVKGTVTNITDYGAFVELEDGIEGLVHISEMSWTKKNIHPGKIVSTSQEVEVMVLEVDPVKRRISLGLKQCGDNPWLSFADTYPVATEVEGEIKNITEFGLFIGLDGDVDGMVHLSDLDWNRPAKTPSRTTRRATSSRPRCSKSIPKKNVSASASSSLAAIRWTPWAMSARAAIVTCEVSAIKDNGIEVSIGDAGMTAFIRRSDLSRDRSEQRPERFAVGNKVDARVTQIDKASRRVSVSIKALEIAEEKEAVAQYGSTDSGASLGDILGAALNKAQEGGRSGRRCRRCCRRESAPDTAGRELEPEAENDEKA